MVMSTVNVVPETTWSFSQTTTPTSNTPLEQDPFLLTNNEIFWIFLLCMSVCIQLWSFKMQA